MTCKVERVQEGPKAGMMKSMTFSCDHSGCAVRVEDNEIIPSGGMRAMGWYCAGGKHYCPGHVEEAQRQ